MEGIGGNSDNPEDDRNFEFKVPDNFLGESSQESNIDLPKLDFDEIIEVAGAMNVRNERSLSEWQEFLADEDYKWDPAQRDTIRMLEHTDLLQRLDKPTIVIDVAGELDSSTDYYAKSLLERGLVANKEQAEARAADLIAKLKEDTSPENDLETTEKFIREISAANKQAKLEGLTIAQVYSDDEQYKRTMQAAYSPAELAEDAMQFHELERIRPSDTEGPDSLSQDIKTEAIYSIINVHGIVGLENLPDGYKEALDIADGAISEEFVSGAPHLPGDDPKRQREADALRTAFSKSYCARQGWNPNQLEPSQLDAIKQQPTWQNPLQSK